MASKAITSMIAIILVIVLIVSALAISITVIRNSIRSGGSNVKSVRISSLKLYGGLTASASANPSSNFTILIDNSGTAITITGITLRGSNISLVTAWDLGNLASPAANNNNFALPYGVANGNAVPPAVVSSYTFYPWSQTQQSIVVGQTFYYIVTFSNGQLISGSVIAL